MSAARRPDAPLRQAVVAMLRALRDTVFPARCLECRDVIQAPGRGRPDEAGSAPDAVRMLRPFFCPSCLRGVIPLDPPLCPRCGVMFKGLSGSDHLCGRCLQRPPSFHMARAAFLYDRSLVDVIHCFKHKGKVQLAAPLGLLLWHRYIKLTN